MTPDVQPPWPRSAFWHGAQDEFHVTYWGGGDRHAYWRVHVTHSLSAFCFLAFMPVGVGHGLTLDEALHAAHRGVFQGTHEEALAEACRRARVLDAAERLGAA